MPSDIEWDPLDPLARVSGETRKANSALRDYYDLGPGRSAEKLYRRYVNLNENEGYEPPSLSSGTIHNWCARWRWVDRTTDQEEIDLQRKQELWQQEIAENAEKWQHRRQEITEQSYQTALRLREAAGNMLEFLQNWKVSESVEEEPNSQGGTDRTVIRTVRPAVSISQLAHALRVSDQLLRLSAGLPQTDTRTRLADSDGENLEEGIIMITVGEE